MIEQKDTHVGHVADRDELAGSCQVEAVHFILHASCYFTVTTAKVCNHQRGRSATKKICFRLESDNLDRNGVNVNLRGFLFTNC